MKDVEKIAELPPIQEEDEEKITEKLDEEALRKREWLDGAWIKLQDNQKWCVSPLSLGASRKRMLEKLEVYGELEDRIKRGEAKYTDLLECGADLLYNMLRQNYSITKAQFDRHELVHVGHIPQFTNAFLGQTRLVDLIEQRKEEENEENDGKKKEDISKKQI